MLLKPNWMSLSLEHCHHYTFMDFLSEKGRILLDCEFINNGSGSGGIRSVKKFENMIFDSLDQMCENNVDEEGVDARVEEVRTLILLMSFFTACWRKRYQQSFASIPEGLIYELMHHEYQRQQ